MALLDSEGFGWTTTAGDLLTYGAFAALPASVAILTSGQFGDNYLEVTNNGGYPIRNLPSATSTFYFGARVHANGNGINAVFQDINGNYQVAVGFNSINGIFTAYRGNFATALGTSAASSAPLSNWFYLEVGATISATVGTFIIRVNGEAVLSLTGQNTQGNVSNTVQRYGVGSASASGFAYSAHWYFCDNAGAPPWNSFLGDVRVQTLLPTSNATVQFTPTGLGANWQNAAKVPPVPATDYNADSTVGHQDTFHCSSIDPSIFSVLGVNHKAIYAKSDSGSRAMQSVLVSGTTTATGTAIGLGTGGTQVPLMFATDPNTSAQWTIAAVNAVLAGYKVAA